MPDENLHEHPVEHARGGYEYTEASMRIVLYFVGSLVVFALVVHGALDLAYWFLDSLRGPNAVSQLALPRDLPPQPRLQVAPGRDMSAFLKQEDQQLTGQAGRVPLDQAMRQVLQSGLPSRPPAPPASEAAGVPLESGGISQVLPDHYLSLAGPGDLGNPYPGGEGAQVTPRGFRTPAHAAPASPGEFGAPPVPSIRQDQEKLGGANVQKRAR